MRTHTLLLLIVLAPALGAQSPAGPLVGRVISTTGAPLSAAMIRVAGTNDTAVSTPEGRFSLITAATGAQRIVARRIGFMPESVTVTLPSEAELVLRLRPAPRALDAMQITAGTYRAGYDRQASLTPVQVVNVPGAAGDIGRAIQSLPGVQSVDEGNGVYVRGGDAGETRVLLNGSAMLIAPRLESPSGTVAPTLNPFLLDGISFSAGTFSVRYGNALSGLVDLRTQGRPTTPQMSANLALNVVALTASTPITSSTGVRVNASHSDSRLALRMNGSTRRYTDAPNGEDVAATLAWTPRRTAELKFFGVQQRSGFGVEANDPSVLISLAGPYSSDQQNRFGSISWKDVFAGLTTNVSASRSQFKRREDVGSSYSRSGLDGAQASGDIAMTISDDMLLRAGTDVEDVTAHLDESMPRWMPNGTNSGVSAIVSRTVGSTRLGHFLEAEWHGGSSVRVTGGIRTDVVGGNRTFDPRADVAFQLSPALSLTAAVGEYHQAVAPTLMARTAAAAPSSAHARQWSLGGQWEQGESMIRAELYGKRYDHLAGVSQAKQVILDGTGDADGFDVFLKGSIPSGPAMRAVYSHVKSVRTDPDARTVASSPADITHSLLVVAEQAWQQNRWRIGGAYRVATGRPFTPIITGSAAPDGLILPVYGSPMSERLPSFTRVDLSLSTVRPVTSATQVVLYATISNVLDRANVLTYRYSSGYETRTPVRSAFKRAFYIGSSFSYTKPR